MRLAERRQDLEKFAHEGELLAEGRGREFWFQSVGSRKIGGSGPSAIDLNANKKTQVQKITTKPEEISNSLLSHYWPEDANAGVNTEARRRASCVMAENAKVNEKRDISAEIRDTMTDAKIRRPDEARGHRTQDEASQDTRTPADFSHSPITVGEVRRGLDTLRNNKAADSNELRAEFLKQGGEELFRVLLQLMNILWATGMVPPSLTHSKIAFIDKRSSHGKQHPKNWRPVAVASLLGKLFESILGVRLSVLLERGPPRPNEDTTAAILRHMDTRGSSFLSPMQSGFRPNRSCADPLMIVHEIIKMRAREGKRTWVASIDIANAFGSVTHAAIINALKKAGVTGRLLKSLTSLLEGTNFHGDASTKKSTVGVRQGSILSPMLWNLGFNEFVSAMNEFGGVPTPIGNIACLAFADDARRLLRSRTS